MVVCGGVERVVRVFESAVPEQSAIISGLRAGEPPPSYRCSTVGGLELVEETRQAPRTASDDSNPSLMQSTWTTAEHRAPISSAICLEFPQPLLVTAATDGAIKIWR